MERKLIILGLDPGFSSLGYAMTTWEDDRLRPLKIGVIHTKKANKKTHVLACEDNFERSRELAVALRRLISGQRIIAVCAEAMSFPRQASVAAKVAMCWGVLADITVTESLALVQPTPQRVKKALCGKITASKEEVQDAVVAYGWTPEDRAALIAQIAALNKGDREHAVDALAVIITSADGEVLRLARKLA